MPCWLNSGNCKSVARGSVCVPFKGSLGRKEGRKWEMNPVRRIKEERKKSLVATFRPCPRSLRRFGKEKTNAWIGWVIQSVTQSLEHSSCLRSWTPYTPVALHAELLTTSRCITNWNTFICSFYIEFILFFFFRFF